MKITFSNPEGQVVYIDTIYPVDMGGGDSVSFAHLLKNCPREVYDYLNSQLKFAKAESREALELAYKIEGLDIR